jgi:stearoyl-CoA desaturase (delta-9 desaturase)
LAKVKKTPPKLALGQVKPVADEHTLEALINNRYEIMAGYALGVQKAFQDEVQALKARSADLSMIKAANKWLHRDEDKVPQSAVPDLAKARAASPVLDKMVTMREELRHLWLNTSVSREQLLADLQAWCHRAEASGIAALRDFSLMLRAARV